MKGYRLSPAAQADLSDIWDFTVGRWGDRQAERYVLAIRDTLDDLVAGHKLARPADGIRPGYRSAVAGSHMIYFIVRDEAIDVIRILHQSMDASGHLPRKRES